MKITKRTILILILSAGIVATSLILITLLAGFRWEYKKFKQFSLTLVAIMLIRYIFLEHIVFVIQALILTFKGQSDDIASRNGEEEVIDAEKLKNIFNPLLTLKLRLKSLQYQLKLDARHRDENLNLEYKQLTEDFWLFGKYFLLLLLVVVYSQNSYTYYNTSTMRSLLNQSYSSNYKMKRLMTINDLYFWINDTLRSAIHEGYDYDEPGRIYFPVGNLLGVMRLQQVRHANKKKSMSNMLFDEQDYLPGWKKLKRSLPYIDKYWRIYYPWLSKHYEGVSNWLMVFRNMASVYTYIENKGYVALLARDHKNNDKILNYLKDHNWLDASTAAVFIDFTLYNADSNMFTICSILVEQTPFGDLVWQIRVDSAELLWNMNEITWWWWLLIIMYTFQLLQFCQVMVIRSWFMPGFFKSAWNWVDLVIVILNVILLIFVIIREYYVLYVMKTFVLANKLEYVDFRVACVFDYTATVTLGLLICLASIRIWKILQFSSIFRIFNRTLYTSTVPLISTVLVIHIFISAVGLAAQILNGSYTENFSRYLKSVTSIMSFSFGFNSRSSPNDLSHGGGVLGFILYLILMFVVAIFLINMFITLICDHFSNAREERDQESPDKLTYWQFLLMEYSGIKEFFIENLPSLYREQNKTVKADINDHIDELEKKYQDQNLTEYVKLQEYSADQLYDNVIQRADRLQNVATVLNIQIDILHRSIMIQSLEWDSDSDS
ncbi:polycystic kidney disease protein 1-like 3 [Lucilia cuprina]|uniref:polycystic kidney disease protein 1-like 3 n=1 Tax=Lucilia cuprina TaxID=7375 RepID=UPI001F05F991|nr:polycystic kidney disease protein 1-like 3 [Lucilia cuprina]